MADPGPAAPGNGGCQCGGIRYEIHDEPVDLYVCHCRECRGQSASAFGISVLFRSADVKIVKGRPKIWSRPTDGGAVLECMFCPACGTRVLHGSLEGDEVVSIKGGSLDIPPDLSNASHIWTSRKLEGVVIPTGCHRYAEEPE